MSRENEPLETELPDLSGLATPPENSAPADDRQEFLTIKEGILAQWPLLSPDEQAEVLVELICGVIPANEAVSYSHHRNVSLFTYDPRAAASRA